MSRKPCVNLLDQAPDMGDELIVKGRVEEVTDIPLPVGHLEITKRNVATGDCIKVVDEKNIIVDNTRTQRSRLLAGDFLPTQYELSTRYIDAVAFGENNIAPTITDTTITNAYEIAVSGVSYPSVSSVKFTALLSESEANGRTFQEVGLMFRSPAPYLAARRTFSAMIKSSDWSWEVNWTLQF